MNTLPRIVGLCLVTGFLIQGCAPARSTLNVDQPGSMIVAQHAQTSDDRVWGEVLSELFATQYQPAFTTVQRGPSLIAGDWLAMQCAIAGGYWDMPTEKDAPAFAEAPESWSRLE